MAARGRSTEAGPRARWTDRRPTRGSSMRALYLFIDPFVTASRRRPMPYRDAADDVDLPPIRPGAFARWAQRDAQRAASAGRWRIGSGHGLDHGRGPPGHDLHADAERPDVGADDDRIHRPGRPVSEGLARPSADPPSGGVRAIDAAAGGRLRRAGCARRGCSADGPERHPAGDRRDGSGSTDRGSAAAPLRAGCPSGASVGPHGALADVGAARAG